MSALPPKRTSTRIPGVREIAVNCNPIVFTPAPQAERQRLGSDNGRLSEVIPVSRRMRLRPNCRAGQETRVTQSLEIRKFCIVHESKNVAERFSGYLAVVHPHAPRAVKCMTRHCGIVQLTAQRIAFGDAKRSQPTLWCLREKGSLGTRPRLPPFSTAVSLLVTRGLAVSE
jgi:hypothetical protein